MLGLDQAPLVERAALFQTAAIIERAPMAERYAVTYPRAEDVSHSGAAGLQHQGSAWLDVFGI